MLCCECARAPRPSRHARFQCAPSSSETGRFRFREMRLHLTRRAARYSALSAIAAKSENRSYQKETRMLASNAGSNGVHRPKGARRLLDERPAYVGETNNIRCHRLELRGARIAIMTPASYSVGQSVILQPCIQRRNRRINAERWNFVPKPAVAAVNLPPYRLPQANNSLLMVALTQNYCWKIADEKGEKRTRIACLHLSPQAQEIIRNVGDGGVLAEKRPLCQCLHLLRVANQCCSSVEIFSRRVNRF